MVKAQEYLDSNYPRNQRNSIVKLDISKKELQGSLIIEGFVNLQELNCSFNGWGNSEGITSLEIKNSPKLEVVKCQYNKISKLNLQKFANLKTFICNDNEFSKLDLSENENLETLNFMNNNFPETEDLFFLKHLTKLKKLELGNGNKGKVEKGVYNRFGGTLEHLAGMSELSLLDIRNTNIDSGLDYLPDSVKTFNCSSNLVKTARVRIIYNLLVKNDNDIDEKGFIKDFSGKLQDYKQKKVEAGEKAKQLEEENEGLKEKLTVSNIKVKELDKQVKSLQDQSQLLTEKTNKLEKGKEDLTKELADEVARKQKVQQQLTEKEEELKVANKENEELREQVAKLEKKTTEDLQQGLQVENNKLKKELKDAQENFQKQLFQLQQQLANSQSGEDTTNLQKAQKKITELESQVDTLNQISIDNNSKLLEFDKRNKELEGENKKLKEKLEEPKVNQSDQEENQVESLREKIKKLEEDILLKSKVAIVFQKNKEDEVDILNSRIKQLENQLKDEHQSNTGEQVANIEQPVKNG